MTRRIGPLKGLVFDVDGTLYRQGPVRRVMLTRLGLEVLKHPHRGWRVARVIHAYRMAQERLRAQGMSGSAGEQLRLACASTRVDREAAASIVETWMERAPLGLLRRYLRPGAAEFLEQAKRRGVCMGVHSDYPAEVKLEAMGLRGYFGVVTCSQQPGVGEFKPNPRGLELTLRQLGVEARDALYVGDRPSVDGETARRAGTVAAIIGQRRSALGEGWFGVPTFRELSASLAWE